MDAFAAKIETLQKYSATRDAFEYAVLGSVHELSFDSEGRVVLPQALMAYAELSEAATFVGLGDHFEIWKPESFAAKIAEAARQSGAAGRVDHGAADQGQPRGREDPGEQVAR